MSPGCAELESLKILQGKQKTKVLMRESIQHYKRMKTVKLIWNDDNAYRQEQKSIDFSLTNLSTQFKKERVNKRVHLVK